MGIFPLPGGETLTPDLQRDIVETPGTDTWRFNDLSHPRSNTSLKVGILGFCLKLPSPGVSWTYTSSVVLQVLPGRHLEKSIVVLF